jgi:hypothetical protein
MTLTLTLTDTMTTTEYLTRSGNNINLIFWETVTAVASPPEVYKIIRSGDTAFARTDYP